MPKNLKTCFLARYCIVDAGSREHYDYVIIFAADEVAVRAFAPKLEHDTNCDKHCIVCGATEPEQVNIKHPFSHLDGETASTFEILNPLTISQAKLLRNIFSFLEYSV